MLDIKLDSTLSFENPITNLCKKASLHLHALARLVSYMHLDKRKCLMKAFIMPQFNYCSLDWMSRSRKLNNHINNIHEKALRLVNNDNHSTFRERLGKDN